MGRAATGPTLTRAERNLANSKPCVYTWLHVTTPPLPVPVTARCHFVGHHVIGQHFIGRLSDGAETIRDQEPIRNYLNSPLPIISATAVNLGRRVLRSNPHPRTGNHEVNNQLFFRTDIPRDVFSRTGERAAPQHCTDHIR